MPVEHVGDFAVHMASCILYGHKGSVAAATAKADIVEPRPSIQNFCRSLIGVSGLSHAVVLLMLKYMQKLVWSLNSYNKYPEDNMKTEIKKSPPPSWSPISMPMSTTRP